ncbi:unnamed protein product [Caenorhabditis angaria]|uniref:Uncharacterized protein n=1 Tax=Caenorhabditis angaria TaxID=860376 RepID=A0A9P1N9J0_9PELO|nr:unnamed protein product [Caenorhabditis angaria]
MLIFCVLVFSVINVGALPRVRRQYWNDSPYYQGARYYEQQQSDPRWNNYQQTNYQVYYPNQFGYQGNWQYASHDSTGYVTPPPQRPYPLPNQQFLSQKPASGYARPDYLRSSVKPTIPVVIERTTQYVTPQPLPTLRPPTFMERMIASGLVPSTAVTSSTNIDGFFDRDVLPPRETSDETVEKKSEEESEDKTKETAEEKSEEKTQETIEDKSEEKSGFIEQSGEKSEELTTTSAPETSTPLAVSTVVSTTIEVLESTTQLPTTSTEVSTTSESTTTVSPTTTEILTTLKVEASTETTTTSTEPSSTISEKPVTLIATQSLENSDENENQIDTEAAKTVFETATGIVGLRPPPIPKHLTDPDEGEASGVEVVKWTDDEKKKKTL